ncbi:MAG: hypothetical protein IRZ13_06225 [Acetobacteraceae bacterium]|nr:hypothetical protein [Acetobacteraceae bacterium]
MWRGVAAVTATLAALLPTLALPAQGQERLSWAMAARACLAGDQRAFVTLAAELPDGAVRLVIHRADGTREFCEALRSGRIRERAPAPAAQPSPRAADPAFFLERRCVDAQRIESADGAILGWLAYPACG